MHTVLKSRNVKGRDLRAVGRMILKWTLVTCERVYWVALVE